MKSNIEFADRTSEPKKRFAGWKNYSETIYDLMHSQSFLESTHWVRPTSAPPSGYVLSLTNSAI